MKRIGNLWPQVTAFDNLVAAARQAQRGKRFRDNVLQFNYELESELIALQTELATHTYCPGPYRTFEIFEPKRRLISAASYRDRVVHHTLCNIIAPVFEHTFISGSYANRLEFGTHKALNKFTYFLRKNTYILQCDIRKYFPSIDHLILKQIIRRKIKCPDTLWLLDTIIDASNEQEPAVAYFPGDDLFTPHERRRGLPIGNLTSQFLANVYLNGFDHFIKEELKAACYVRYMDDFALFSDNRAFLKDARLKIEAYLANLRLRIHPIKSQLFETRRGANFLGFRVFPEYIRVRAGNLGRARRRFRHLQDDYQKNKIESAKVLQSLRSWSAHLAHADTWRLREQVFSALVFTRGNPTGYARS